MVGDPKAGTSVVQPQIKYWIKLATIVAKVKTK